MIAEFLNFIIMAVGIFTTAPTVTLTGITTAIQEIKRIGMG